MRLTVAQHGELEGIENENFIKSDNLLKQSWSVDRNSVEKETVVKGLLFIIGKKISLTCIAKNTKPEGIFVWRIGNKTLKNINPMELKYLNGDFIVQQDLEFQLRSQMDGKSVYCFHLQLDHEGKAISIDFIEARFFCH